MLFTLTWLMNESQILGLLFMREGTSWWTAWRTRGSRPMLIQHGSNRPLLTAPEPDEETAEADAQESRSYGALNDEDSRTHAESSNLEERNAWEE